MPLRVTDQGSFTRAQQTRGEFGERGGGQLTTPQAPITASEQLGAAFDLENIMVNVYRRMSEPRSEDVEAFDPLDHLRPGEETVASRFSSASSETEMNNIRARIDREEDARRLLAGGPMNDLLATTIAVVGDPTTLIPFAGGLIKGGKGATTAAKVARVAGASAVDVAAGEAALQSFQETRTLQESALAVMLGGAFGAGVGGVSAAVTNRAYAAAVKDTRAVLEALDDSIPIPDSVGAMAAARLSPEDTQVAGGKITRNIIESTAKILKPMRFVAPSLELSVSRFNTARTAVGEMVDTGIVTQGTARGLAAPVALETKIKRYETLAAHIWTDLNTVYKEFRAAGGKMSRNRFYQEIGRAMRRGDDHLLPHVSKAAKHLRAKVFEPLKKEAIAAKLLPEDVDVNTAASYFSRVYRQDLIKAQRPKFKKIIADWLETQLPKEGPGRVLDPGELGIIADDIINTIQGAPGGRVPFFSIPDKRGPLKERTFNIPDELIEDFLEDSALDVSLRYVRTLGADIEFARKFGRTDLDEVIAKMSDEKDDLLEKAANEKERIAIEDDFQRQADLLQEMAANLRGVNRAPYDPAFTSLRKMGRIARNLNFARLLGSVLVSSVPDIGRIVMEEGLTKTFGGLLRGLGNGFKGIRLAKKEAQLAGTALDLVMSQRSHAMFDLGERFVDEARGTGVMGGLDKAARASDAMASGFSKITLLNHWNAALKSTTAAMVSSRILETVRKIARGQQLTDRELRKLAQGGIDRAMAERIAKEADKWDEVDGLLLPNTEDWADRQAMDAFRNALIRDVDNTIVTPGVGDAPLWTSKEWGKSIFQLKKFASASTQRMLLAGVQGTLTFRDISMVNGMMVMVGLGWLGTAVRDYVSQGELRDRSASQWATDAVDRSGLLSMFFELDAVGEKLGLPTPVSLLTGDEGASRFQSRDLLGQLGGPTVGLASETGSALHGMLTDDVTQSDLHKIRKLFPGQNLFYTRYALDKIEEATAKELGLRQRGEKKSSKSSVANPVIAR